MAATAWEAVTASGGCRTSSCDIFLVAQLGPDFLLVDNPVDHAPAVAAVVMQVDESERRWNVRSPHGISADNTQVPIASVS
jgi:hypothetical protein